MLMYNNITRDCGILEDLARAIHQSELSFIYVVSVMNFI
jgi:hypothetical protein